MCGGRRSCSSCRIPPQSTPQPQQLQGWGGLNPSSEPAPSSSAVLEPAGTGAVAGTGHPPAPGWERRGWLQSAQQEILQAADTLATTVGALSSPGLLRGLVAMLEGSGMCSPGLLRWDVTSRVGERESLGSMWV